MSFTFLKGPFGTGKTRQAVEHLKALLRSGVAAESILILAPQRTMHLPYLQVISDASAGPLGEVTLTTIGGLARRACDLFWPLAAEVAGFAHPESPPIFLTLETAQYFMAHVVRPLLEEGFFASLTIDRNRLYSQILDNLNKSAAIGFPYTEIGIRLDAAWMGDPAQRRIYADAQECATRFRQFCLEHNLLDFSLQLEVFWRYLWPQDTVRAWFSRYRHLIYDNIEEDIPIAHDWVGELLPTLDSALLIYDEGGGYRKFLGADPISALTLADCCDRVISLSHSWVTSPQIETLRQGMQAALRAQPLPALPRLKEHLQATLVIPDFRFYPQMLDWVANETARLVQDEGLPPSEIVILAPYLSDALRFSLLQRLEERQVPARSHRPSRSLQEEPATHALVTLALLAHPEWQEMPSEFDVARAWMLALNTDWVRAWWLTKIVYRLREGKIHFTPFELINPEEQERLTAGLGLRYSTVRQWLLEYQQQSEKLPLDHFWQKLFGEVLSQPGFGFHNDLDAVRVAATLVESAFKFRQALWPILEGEDSPVERLNREYLAMLREGVIAAQYLEAWQMQQAEAVLIAPAHTFIMMNRPVEVQFWLDVGSSGWYERLYQPLTHPYVLSRHWEVGRPWTDADEVQAAQEGLARLIDGLFRRCRRRVYLGISELGESGFEQRGRLLLAFQRLLQSSQ
ncbi:MAG: hypothetical protein ACK4VW_01780 [Anaerolineales bacterium]